MNLELLAWAALPLYMAGLLKRRFLLAGCLVQAAYLLARAEALGGLPLVGPHETIILLAASIAGFSAFFRLAPERDKKFRIWIVAIAVVLSFLAMLARPFEGPLPPVLDTWWFEVHVGLSFFSYALFGIGALLGIIYLGQGDADLEKSQYRSILYGYLLFSLAMIAGGIWAYLAWGSYWLWTPKELWTSILWLYYALYLHLRLRPAWHGKKAALAGAAGFVVVLFTYLGVGLLMKSSHTF